MGRKSRLLVALVLSATACSRSNNLLLGRVEAKLGTHEVVVTDCYRINVPAPMLTAARQSWEPCRDAVIIIEGEKLAVNGRDYGRLNASDSVLVDHGVVSTHSN
jgi:hypothetical protein